MSTGSNTFDPKKRQRCHGDENESDADAAVKQVRQDRTRKRRRRRQKRMMSGDGQDKSSESIMSMGNRKLPLIGHTLAVSTLVESSSTDTGEASGTVYTFETLQDTMNYKTIMALCKDAGASTTGQLHKGVFCLVATESAVLGETQRVRKAWKKGIPIVTPEWIKKCMETKQVEPFDHYKYRQQRESAKPSSKKRKTKQIESTKSVETLEEGDTLPTEGWSERVDLGCCCLCHETEDGDNLDNRCPWCEDCSVMKERRQRLRV